MFIFAEDRLHIGKWNKFLCARFAPSLQKSINTNMNKGIIYAACGILLVSGCKTTGEGAYIGAQFGTILGSAIGGISGGWRGSDIGTVVGMAGGAAVGAAIGSANEKADREKYEAHRRERAARARQNTNAAAREYGYDGQQTGGQDDSGFDPTNSGDDRIVFENGDVRGTYPVDDATASGENTGGEVSLRQLERMTSGAGRIDRHGKPTFRPTIEVRKMTFTDADGDGILSAGESGKVMFEIMNNSPEEIRNIRPVVSDTTNNKRISISPSILVESIAPGMGVRYTATVLGDRRLKDGEIVILAGVEHDGRMVTTENETLKIATRRK